MFRSSKLNLVICLILFNTFHVLAKEPRDVLDEHTELKYIATPLQDVVKSLEDRHGVEFVFGGQADGKMHVTIEEHGRLSDLLAKLLKPIKLTYRVDGSKIEILPIDPMYYERFRKRRLAEQTEGAPAAAAIKALSSLDARIVPASYRSALYIELQGAQITDDQLRHIEAFRYVVRLSIKNSKITDEGLQHLKPSQKPRWLFLYNNNITDAGLAHVKSLSSVKFLDLAGTKVSDEGLIHLAALKRLEMVRLSNTKVTKEGVEELRHALPNVRIILDDEQQVTRNPFVPIFP